MLRSSNKILVYRKFIINSLCFIKNLKNSRQLSVLPTYHRPSRFEKRFNLPIASYFSRSTSTDTKERKSKYHEMEKNLKYRENPVITTLDTPEFHSIFTPNLKSLHQLFEKYDYEIRIAGGAVRLVKLIPYDPLLSNQNRMSHLQGPNDGHQTGRY